ncbi:hypothetical protein D3C71_1846270 [compost metagenome]
MLAVYRRVGDDGGPLVLKPQHDFRVQRLQSLSRHFLRMVTEADDVDVGRRHEFELGLCLDEAAQIMALSNILVDEAAKLLDAVLHQ